jgi:hypothetical protein
MVLEVAYRESAARIRSWLVSHVATPESFRVALTRVPPEQRDSWLDLVLGIEALPDDGPHLPRGCVPYLPCSVDAVLRMVEQADVGSRDVFVDIGSGLGRAAILTHLLTGAGSIGLEIQPHLVHASRDLTSRLNVSRCPVVRGDAARLAGYITIGSVFFLNCPFGGARLAQVLDDLESIAQTRPIRVCALHLPLPPRAWLTRVLPPSADLEVYRSTPLEGAPRSLPGTGP